MSSQDPRVNLALRDPNNPINRQIEAQQQAAAIAAARRQAEEDRKAAQEAQRQEQADAAIRAANSRAASDPLAQQGRFNADVQQAMSTGKTIKTLQDMGYDINALSFTKGQNGQISNVQGLKIIEPPKSTKPAPTIDYAAETAQDFALFKDLSAKGQNPQSLSVTRSYGNAQTQRVDPYSNTLVPLEARAEYVTLVPVRNAPPSRTAEPGTAEYYRQQVGKGSNRSADTSAMEQGYSIFKENQIIEAANKGAPSAYRLTNGEISNIRGATGVQNLLTYAPAGQGGDDFGVLTPVSGRYGVYESRNNFGGYDRTIFTRTEAPAQKEYYVPDQTMPFDIRTREAQTQMVQNNKPAPPPPNDPIAGFLAPLKNTYEDFSVGTFGIGAGFEALARGAQGKKVTDQTLQRIETRGQQANASYQKELEGDVIGGSVRYAKGDVGGLNEFRSDVGASPLYYAGAALGSALTFIGPGLIGKGKTAVELVRGATRARTAEAAAAEAGEIGGFESAGVQAVKTVKGGSDVPLTKNLLGVYTTREETSRYPTIFQNVGRTVNIPRSSRAVGIPALTRNAPKSASPDLFMIREGELGTPGAVNPRTGSTFITLPGLGEKEAKDLATRTEVRSITQVYSKESEGLQRLGVGGIVGKQTAAEGGEFTVKSSKGTVGPSGDIFDLTARERLPTTIESAMPQSPIFSKSPVIRETTADFAGLPRAPRENLIGSVVEFDTKALARSAAAREAAARAGASAQKRSVMNTRGFDFGGVIEPRTAEPSAVMAPLPVRATGSLEDAIKLVAGGESRSAAREASSGNVAASLFGGARYQSSNRSLGFGGATGAERTKSSQREEVDLSYDVVRYPPSTRQNEIMANLTSNRNMLDLGLRNEPARGSSSGVKLVGMEATKLNLGSMSLLGESSRLDLVPVAGIMNEQGNAFNFDLDTKQQQQTELTNIFKFPNPTRPTPNNPRVKDLYIPPAGEVRRKKRKGKKGYYKSTPITYNVNGLLGFALGRTKQNLGWMRAFSKLD